MNSVFEFKALLENKGKCMKKLLLGLTLLASMSSFAEVSKTLTYDVKAGDKIVLISSEIKVRYFNGVTGFDEAERLLSVKCNELDGELVGTIQTHQGLDKSVLDAFNPASQRYFSICKY